MPTASRRAAHAFCISIVLLVSMLSAARAEAQRINVLPNGGVEDGSFPAGPFGWSRQAFAPTGSLTWDVDVVHDGSHSIKIAAERPNDAAWIQTISLRPDTNYLLSGWIKTENVQHTSESVDAGANLNLYGTWERTAAKTGTADWTEARMTFNSGSTGTVTIGARLGFWSGTTTGTAWFDDLRVTEILPTDPHPRWKLLVLVYDTTDFRYLDGATTRHVVGTIDQAQSAAAAAAATRFVLTDIPVLTSGNMVPEVTIRYPGTLTRLSPNGIGWWPSPDDTALERDPAFDSVIVIWQPTVTDQDTGESLWIGSAAGLTPGMGVSQMYATLIIEAATLYGHLNVFKHEWGHSILSYFDAARTAPQPAVSNHAESSTYVNCLTGQYYVWVDETDANPIPNSIYHNDSGFTHDYYSGTTALATDPARCLGIPPAAWATDGPVSKAIIDPVVLPVSDATPPATTAAVSPPSNPAGWNNSEVTVRLASGDGEGGSGVKLITYSVAGAESIPATTVAGTAASVHIASEGVSTITFHAIDNAGNVEVAHELTVSIDRTAPGLTAPPDQVIRQTNGAGAIVTYRFPEILETGSGLSAATCAPLSGSTFPVGVTTVTCTARDRADNIGSIQFNVTVIPASSPDRLMLGAGLIVKGNTHHRFVFRVAQAGHRDSGRFEYWVTARPGCSSHDDPRQRQHDDGRHDCDEGRNHHDRPDHFEATSISSAVFSDDSHLRSNAGFKKAVTSVSFSGRGTWNGHPGHTFEVSAVDGQKADRFSLVIRNPLRQVVASVAATLDGGAIHAIR